ncbi:MAG: PilZ domain-containing protein [Desulfobacteraceae bacterium]
MKNERRLNPRIDFRHEVAIRGSQARSRFLNFSTGGAFIQTEEPLRFKPGGRMEVITTLPLEKKAMSIRARVAHVKRNGIGVEFEDVWGRDAVAIDHNFEVFKATIPLYGT